MGFPGFPGLSVDFWSVLLINAVLSVAALVDCFRSLFRILGLISGPPSNHAAIDPRAEAIARESPWPSYPSDAQPSVLGSGLAQLPLIAEEIRDSLPIVLYENASESANASTHVECAVCLSKFEEGDQMRELPCHHFFHKGCLDKWLDHQQTTCPLCRSSLVPEETAIKLRRREQELTEELLFWFSSFHGNGFHSMWWLRLASLREKPATQA